ncbi:DJ-1/PfpI family protein [Adhaeribacter radiodurans]|uniref:DJ-1/PfpI family protein n=1 Tax=Adhaeribacter radiodurans TaxID=2745197 RepID=A0A7L7L7L2_9BACT|nr:DJ-1/PfpI family protein [Adhaeribacter radiodurans]QMU28744.1 DJ-1/PfpI family protein [Adhaeribacter radiodurans]
MKKTKTIVFSIITSLLVLSFLGYLALQPVIAQGLKVYTGKNNMPWSHPTFDKEKKTVFIVAENNGTEMFDLMAPYYLFNATEKANVYVVSERKAPILLVNSLFILPHFSFSEIDSLRLKSDVIVIPNQTVYLKTPPNPTTVAWIKQQYTGDNIILAVCDGSVTAAATSLYDGKPITTHSSDWNKAKKLYPKGNWVQQVSYTKSNNLYSTAGVSNATEGSLAVIEEVFGKSVMEKVMKQVHYPHAEIKTIHQNLPFNTSAVLTIAKKVLFKKDKNLGVLLQDSINEFELASVLDTYTRTFPASLNTFVLNGTSVTSQYGLTLLPTANLPVKTLDELHVLRPENFSRKAASLIAHKELVMYQRESLQYPFLVCLDRIKRQYGSNFQKSVKLMLDYN